MVRKEKKMKIINTKKINLLLITTIFASNVLFKVARSLYAQIELPGPGDEYISSPLLPNCDGYGEVNQYFEIPPGQAADDFFFGITGYSILCSGYSYDDFAETTIEEELLPYGYDPIVSDPFFFPNHGYFVIPLKYKTENPMEQFITEFFLNGYTYSGDSGILPWSPDTEQPIKSENFDRDLFPLQLKNQKVNLKDLYQPTFFGGFPKPKPKGKMSAKLSKIWDDIGAIDRLAFSKIIGKHLDGIDKYAKTTLNKFIQQTINGNMSPENIIFFTKELARTEAHRKILKTLLENIGDSDLLTQAEVQELITAAWEYSEQLVNML